MDSLEGKVAVVTGGGSGIGSGIARALAETGTHVVVADIELAEAVAVANDLRTRSIAVAVDVTNLDSVIALADRAFDEFGQVHIVCNNAGVMLSGPMFNMKPADWEWTFAVNVQGVVNGIYAFVPRLLDQGEEAHIVNTASMASFASGVNHSAYTASKHACTAITEALRGELAETPIMVSGLYPGAVATDIMNSQRHRQERFGAPTPFELPGGGTLEERMAEAAAFLLEPIEVGRIVRQAILDRTPWIFTHPTWLTSTRWDEIQAAATSAARNAI